LAQASNFFISPNTNNSDEPIKIIKEVLDENFYKTLAVIWRDEKVASLGQSPTTEEENYNTKSNWLKHKDNNTISERERKKNHTIHLYSSKTNCKNVRNVNSKQCKSRTKFLETTRKNGNCFKEQPLIEVKKKSLNKIDLANLLGKKFCDSIIKRYEPSCKDFSTLDIFKDVQKFSKISKSKSSSYKCVSKDSVRSDQLHNLNDDQDITEKQELFEHWYTSSNVKSFNKNLIKHSRKSNQSIRKVKAHRKLQHQTLIQRRRKYEFSELAYEIKKINWNKKMKCLRTVFSSFFMDELQEV
jgi:hypothetical protein